MRLLLAFLLCVFGTTQATTYYIKPTGSNASAGTSWATAWAHPNYTNNRISTGDTVRFAPGRYDTTCIRPPRGGTSWTVYACSSLTNVDSCRTTTILSGAMPVTDSWVSLPASVYRHNGTIAEVGGAWSAGEMIVEQSGTLFAGQNTVGAVNNAQESYYDPATDQLYIYGIGGANPTGTTVRVSQRPVVRFDYGDQDMIQFIGLTMEMGYQGTIILAHSNMGADASDSIWVMHCNVQKAGTSESGTNVATFYAGMQSGGYPTTVANLGRYNKAVACTVRSARDLADYSSGIDLYAQEYFTIDSCYVGDYNNSPYSLYFGIGFKFGQTGTGPRARSNIISNTTVVNSRAGIWWGSRQVDLFIYGNYILDCQYRGIDIHSTLSNLPYMGNCRIYNNTIYNCGSTVDPDAGEAIMISPWGQDSAGVNDIRYNVIFDTATVATYTISFVTQGGEAPQQTPALETVWDIDSNMYWRGSAGSFGTRFTGNSGCSGTNFASFQSCGFGANDVITNPIFDASHTKTLTRISSNQEMNRTYGGKTWTRYGAWQPTGCATPSAPTLVTPGNGASGLTNTVTLDWSDVSGAAKYYIQVDTVSSFTGSLIVNDSASASTYACPTLANGETYYWRVMVRTCDFSAWSSSRSFSMYCTPPSAPTLISPTDGDTIANLVTLICSGISDAVSYEFKVSPNSDFSVTYYVIPSDDSTVTLDFNLSNGTRYYWEARGYGANCDGTFSSTGNFYMESQADTIVIAIIVENNTSRTTIGADTLLGDFLSYSMGYTVHYRDVDSVAGTLSTYWASTYDGVVIGGRENGDANRPSPTTVLDTITNAVGLGVLGISDETWDELNIGIMDATDERSVEATGYMRNVARTHWITKVFPDTVYLRIESSVINYNVLTPDSLHEVVPLLIDKDFASDTSRAIMTCADEGDTIFNTGDGRNVAKGRRVFFSLFNFQTPRLDSCQFYTLFGRAVAWMVKDTLGSGVMDRICFSGPLEIDWASVVENSSGTDSIEVYGNYDSNIGQDSDEKHAFFKINNGALQRKVVSVYRTVDVNYAQLKLGYAGTPFDNPATTWTNGFTFQPIIRYWQIGRTNCIFGGSCPYACWTYTYGDTVAGVFTGHTWGIGGARQYDVDTRQSNYDTLVISESTPTKTWVGIYLQPDTLQARMLDTTMNFGWASRMLHYTRTPSGSDYGEMTFYRPMNKASDTGFPGPLWPTLNIILGTTSVSEPDPVIDFDSDSLVFSSQVGIPPNFQLNRVLNSNGGAMSCGTVSDDQTWLTVTTPGGGDAPFYIVNSIDVTGLSAGYYSATVTVGCSEASNTPQTYKVALTLTAVVPSPAIEQRAGFRKQ